MNKARKAIFVLTILLMVSLAVTGSVYANLLPNPSFETVGPNGPSTSFTGYLPGGPSAAQDWAVWNNTFGTTTTELVPSTLPGGGNYMMRVTTDPPLSAGSANGLYTTFLFPSESPVIGSAWIYVVSGRVGIGTGNNGATQWDALTSTTGKWEFLKAPNGIFPPNEFIIYSYSSQAEFYVDNASVTPAPFVKPNLPYVTTLKLGNTLSFDYLWQMGINPPPYQPVYMFDVLALQGGNGWQFIGQIDAYGSSTGWNTAMLNVPQNMQGTETQIRFVLTDYDPQTDPTVYLNNITAVPEPSLMVLLGISVMSLVGLRRWWKD